MAMTHNDTHSYIWQTRHNKLSAVVYLFRNFKFLLRIVSSADGQLNVNMHSWPFTFQSSFFDVLCDSFPEAVLASKFWGRALPPSAPLSMVSTKHLMLTPWQWHAQLAGVVLFSCKNRCDQKFVWFYRMVLHYVSVPLQLLRRQSGRNRAFIGSVRTYVCVCVCRVSTLKQKPLHLPSPNLTDG